MHNTIATDQVLLILLFVYIHSLMFIYFRSSTSSVFWQARQQHFWSTSHPLFFSVFIPPLSVTPGTFLLCWCLQSVLSRSNISYKRSSWRTKCTSMMSTSIEFLILDSIPLSFIFTSICRTFVCKTLVLPLIVILHSLTMAQMGQYVLEMKQR